MPRPVKWLLWIAATASGLAVLLAITLAMILNTASGTRWAIEHVTAQLPGELRIEAVDGTLWKGLTMSGLTYSDAERAAEAVNVNVRIDWPAILSGRLAIGLLQADYIEYRSMAAWRVGHRIARYSAR
jgi:autotransporter translocation and assembly factor TamB